MGIRIGFIGAAVCALWVIPATAQVTKVGDSVVSVFAATPLSDDALDAVTGMGLGPNFEQNAVVLANNDAILTAQQFNSVSRLILDNWINDVAAPLIFSNRLAAIGD